MIGQADVLVRRIRRPAIGQRQYGHVRRVFGTPRHAVLADHYETVAGPVVPTPDTEAHRERRLERVEQAAVRLEYGAGPDGNE